MTCAANTVDRSTCDRCGKPTADHLTRDGGRETYCPTYLDAATIEIGRLSHVMTEVRRLTHLSSSDLLIAWRRHCLEYKRFNGPDWETGEAGMLRELVRAAIGGAP